jgi:hypothetical protein
MDNIKNHVYNLDENIEEYFEFIILGHKYRFRYPSTEEMFELKDAKDETLFERFITKVEENSPEFSETSKKMISPHWLAFKEMIYQQIGGNDAKLHTSKDS